MKLPEVEVTLQVFPFPDLDSLLNQVSEIAEDIKAITKSLKDSIGTQEGTESIKEILTNYLLTLILQSLVVESLDVPLHAEWHSRAHQLS